MAITVDPRGHRATAKIRGDLDPVLLDGQKRSDVPQPARDGWILQRMSTNRSFTLDGVFLPAEFFAVGNLREGVWDMNSPQQDSRATWHLDGHGLRMRLPWSMLAIGDPSSHTAIQPTTGRPKAVTVSHWTAGRAGAGGSASGVVTWEGWQKTQYAERLKPGVQPLVDAWAVLGRPTR